ncbi:hypothetical protein ABVT39_020071 [Epinephelus coioides]
MNARWRSTLSKAMEVQLSFCTDVVMACAFLHNICISNGDIMEPEEAEDAGEAAPVPPEEVDFRERSGTPIRGRLTAQVSAPVAPPAQLMEHDYCQH